MLKIQDTCTIMGVIYGKGRHFDFKEGIGGTGGGGGGLEITPAGGGNTIGTSAYTYPVAFDRFAAPYSLNGGKRGDVLNISSSTSIGGDGSSLPSNYFDKVLSATDNFYLMGGEGGKNSIAPNDGCCIISNGGKGGAGIYILCNILNFTGSINLEGQNGVSFVPVSLAGCGYTGSSSGGGSGGGGGGAAVIKTQKILTNTGNILTAGGLGGLGGSSTFNSYTSTAKKGGAGGNGWYIIIVD